MKKLVFGTKNKGKAAEMRSLIAGLEIDLVDLSSFENIVEPTETGESFEQNAEIKARAYSIATGHFTVADDSGLEVVALGHRPGIYSARFSGKGATDEENNAKLLNEIAMASIDDRTARFVCALCLVAPGGQTIFSEIAYCDGEIAAKPSGFNGFGYDPIFIPRGYSQTFGELPAIIKQSISHRSQAAAKLAEFLASNLDLLA